MSLSGTVRLSTRFARHFGTYIFSILINLSHTYSLRTSYVLILLVDDFTNLPTFQAAIARVSALLVAKKEKKAAPPKKTRGKKAKTA